MGWKLSRRQERDAQPLVAPMAGAAAAVVPANAGCAAHWPRLLARAAFISWPYAARRCVHRCKWFGLGCGRRGEQCGATGTGGRGGGGGHHITAAPGPPAARHTADRLCAPQTSYFRHPHFVGATLCSTRAESKQPRPRTGGPVPFPCSKLTIWVQHDRQSRPPPRPGPAGPLPAYPTPVRPCCVSKANQRLVSGPCSHNHSR